MSQIWQIYWQSLEKLQKIWPKHKVSKSDRLDLDLPHKYSMRKQDYFEKIINIHAPEEIS